MKNKRKYKLFFCCYLAIAFCFCLVIDVFGQSERQLIRDGNKLYNEKKFTDAEVKYKKSMNVNKNSPTGQFNLGDAYYKEGKYEDATQQYQPLLSSKEVDDKDKARVLHNLGNSFLQSKKYEESINAFKNSLKLNPKDNDTRYNLAYAQSMLRQQQQQQNKNNQNKNQDNKQDQKKQQQQDKDQQKKEQQKEDQKQAQQKPKISKEDAEKMLQALNNDEKNTQKKLVKKESSKVVVEKSW